MANNCYSAGKKSGATHTSYGMGKKPNITGAKVSYSAGKDSGTNRKGDSGGAPAMGKGK
jgi:hypothetical protein